MSDQVHFEDVTDEPEEFQGQGNYDNHNNDNNEYGDEDDGDMPPSTNGGRPSIPDVPKIDYRLNEEMEVPGTNGRLFKTLLKAAPSEKAKYPTNGSTVSVWYCGRLGPKDTDVKFDSARDRNEPFEFQLGGGVITGWNVGVATMKVGERALFKIDHSWAYGEAGSPPRIPPRATLWFDIELLSFNRRADDVSKNRDKGVMKIGVLTAGRGSERPAYESSVTFDVAVYKGEVDLEEEGDDNHDDGSADKEAATEFEKSDWSFEIGDLDVPQQFDDAVGSLKRGEVSFFYIRGREAPKTFVQLAKLITGAEIDEADAARIPLSFTLKIRMKDFDVKQTWGWKNQDKIDQAVQRKDAGNNYFKAKALAKALRKYERSLTFVENDYGLDTDELKQKAEELTVAVRGNMAQCFLMLNKLSDAVKECDKILELQPANSKAKFRKAKALNLQQEFDEAEKLLREILVAEPSNSDVAAELNGVLAGKKAYNDKQKKLYGNMFA